MHYSSGRADDYNKGIQERASLNSAMVLPGEQTLPPLDITEKLSSQANEATQLEPDFAHYTPQDYPTDCLIQGVCVGGLMLALQSFSSYSGQETSSRGV